MIKIERFSKAYGDVRAVDGLTLAVEKGRITALLGPNGSGKSTTLKAAVGLVKPSSGRIVVDGFDVVTERQAALSRISFLPQRIRFPESLSGREVLRFYARLRGLPGDSAAAAAATTGLDGALDRPVGEYSGGMLQRLGLAVLSLPNAPVLLLDEPTAGLDPAGSRAFRDWLQTQRDEGKTVLLTTHRLEDAEDLADQVAILVRGKLVADMTPAEVRRREAVEVWLRIINWNVRYQQLAQALGAETLCADPGGDYVFAAPAARAVEIMNVLRDEGAEILRFTSRSSLETFYHHITNEERYESS
ncbi:MAG: ABC transporter ATP-binding protein [Acidobacteriota bacterium]